MRILFLLVGLLLALVALGAEGAMKAGPPMAGPGHHRLKGVSGGTPPLDAFTTPTGAYSFRKLRTAYAGPAIRIRRTSDNLELDINFLGYVPGLGAPWDEAAANAHCAATTCTVVTWYDQSGNLRHLTQATPANQPPLIFNCIGTLPCLRMTAGTTALASAGTFTPATGVLTISAVAQRSLGTGACAVLRQNGNSNRVIMASGAAQWTVTGGTSGSISRAATPDGVPHAGIAVINGASSLMGVDGVEATGSVTGATVAGATTVLGIAATQCDEGEVMHWDNYAMPAPERAVLQANQKSFFGTP